MRFQRSRCFRIAASTLFLMFPVLFSGCGKSTLLGSESYYGFTPDSLRAHGMFIAGIGSQVDGAGQPDLLTLIFYESVWKACPDLWESLPFDLHSAMGTEKHALLITRFVKNGKLGGNEVLEIVSLHPSGRYVALGRLLVNSVEYDRETTEQMSPDYQGANIPGYVYKTKRTIEVETVVYDLKTGSLVWRGTRRADHKAESAFVQDDDAKDSDSGGFWGFLDWLFSLGGPGKPTGAELEKYPSPPGIENLAGDLFKDVARDLTGETS
jgi:hypothetical protein